MTAMSFVVHSPGFPTLHERKLRQKTREWIDYYDTIVSPDFDVATWAKQFPGRLIYARLRSLRPECSHAVACVGSGEYAPIGATEQATPRRLVVCAALRNKTGGIICGVRHFDTIMRDQIKAAGGIEEWRGADQGFVDQFGQFLSREDARSLAVLQGQVRYRCGGDAERLFSENLY